MFTCSEATDKIKLVKNCAIRVHRAWSFPACEILDEIDLSLRMDRNVSKDAAKLAFHVAGFIYAKQLLLKH